MLLHSIDSAFRNFLKKYENGQINSKFPQTFCPCDAGGTGGRGCETLPSPPGMPAAGGGCLGACILGAIVLGG